jgi:hypothetical protein
LSRVRVLLAGLGTLEREILMSTLVDPIRIDVVGWTDELAHLPSSMWETGADVVVVSVPSANLPRACAGLFESYPRIRFVAIEEGGRTGALYMLLPRRIPLGPVWPDRLAAAIMQAAGITQAAAAAQAIRSAG